MLIIQQKLPFLVVGFIAVTVVSFFIFKSFIIRTSRHEKSKGQTQKKQLVKKYTVEEGEDLWQIAEKNYGSGFNAFDIAKANNLKEPYILQKGQILIIPDVSKRSPTQGELTPESASTGQVTLKDKTYEVQAGDFLFDIALRAYGDGNLMWKIIDANNIPPPYDIEVGRVLVIPR